MQLFPETNLIRLARQSRYRHHWAVDLLIAILLLLISISVQSTLALPVVLISLLLRSVSGGPLIGDIPSLISDLETSDQSALLSLYLTAVLILIPVLYCTLLERRPLESLGFSRGKTLLRYFAGLLLGLVMLSASLGICLLTDSVFVLESSSDPFLILAFFCGYMIQGMSEEVLCRGFLLQTLSVRYRPVFAILISSLFFAALHLFNSGITVLSLFNLFLFGVFASVCIWKRESIWEIAAVHAAWNFTQGNLYGIKVSGMASGPSFFITVIRDSKSLWNGGSFGLEGGLAVTAVLVLFTVILLVFPKTKGE